MSIYNSLLNAHRVLERFFLKRQNPQFDQYMSRYKFPQHAKIVVLGGQFPLLQNLISKQFASFNHFSVSNYLKGVSPVEGGQEKQLVTDIAQFLLRPEGKGAYGHILTDFPKNVEQAKGLDEVLEGINLAIKFEISPGLEQDLNGKYLQCKSCGKVFNLGTSFSSPEGVGVSNCEDPSACNIVKLDKDLPIQDSEYSQNIKELENYYEERGLLMRFRVCPKKAALTFEELNQKLYEAIESSIKL